MPDDPNHQYPYTPMTLGELHQKTGELLQQQIPETPTNVLLMEARDVLIAAPEIRAHYQRRIEVWTLPPRGPSNL